MINKRLSSISCDSREFDRAKPDYEAALRKSGYNTNLNFSPRTNTNRQRNRKRNITWYNPPFNRAVKKCIGKTFLSLIDKHFPPNHHLHKIINRNTIKIGYSCTKNIRNFITAHNSKVLKDNEKHKPSRTCNCRSPPNCPLSGNCLTEAVVYKATATANAQTCTYIGGTEGPFKTRFNGHVSDFKLPNGRKKTTLSKHVWSNKDKGLETKIKWEVLHQCHPYVCGSRKCDVCITEKAAILLDSNQQSLNSRSDLLKKCPHAGKWRLKSK